LTAFVADACDSDEVIEKRTFTCRDCGHLFDNRFEVTQHRKTGSSAHEYACDSESGCCRGFDTKDVLDEHKAKAKHGM